jgi:hypothetical protein
VPGGIPNRSPWIDELSLDRPPQPLDDDVVDEYGFEPAD